MEEGGFSEVEDCAEMVRELFVGGGGVVSTGAGHCQQSPCCRFRGSGATVEKAIHGVSAAQGNKKGKPEEVNAIPLYAPQHLTCSDGVSGILKIEHKIQNAECSLETLNTSFVR